MRCRNIFFLLLLAHALTACQSSDPKRVEKDFGNSVRHMIKQQIHTGQVSANPAERGPDILDGATAVETIDQYQRAAKKPQNSVTGVGAQ